MPTSLPRGWLLGFSLWFASTAWLYAYMSRAQAEQAWELGQLRREMSELHREVISCQLERGEVSLPLPLGEGKWPRLSARGAAGPGFPQSPP